MKQRMDAHRGTQLGRTGPQAARVLGHDVKLGEGGIREVEFCAQTLQLVWGGRTPALRVAATLAALDAAARSGHLPAATAGTLKDAYVFLRSVEHRLQMIADRQTHLLRRGCRNWRIFRGSWATWTPPISRRRRSRT